MLATQRRPSPVGPRSAAAICVTALLVAGAARAQGTTETCVEVRGPDAPALARLVASELDRHPTHRAAPEGGPCLSHLRVELVEVGGERYLTGRINAQVPHREPVTGDLASALSDLLRIVLHSDPLRLEDPARADWLRSQKRLMQRRGVTLFGVEAFQTGGAPGDRLTALPGLALTARREVDRWHLGVRLAGAYAPFDAEHLRLVGQVSAHLELSYFLSDEATASPFASVLLGLEHQRFRGPSPVSGDRQRGATATGFGAGLRAGVEMFRAHDMRMLVFLQGNLPAFTASDAEGEVVDAWVPTFSAGVGAAF